MKSKDLIALLQKEDPTGETEVCVNNSDILCVYKMPAYYDGSLEVLVRDPSKEPYYDVIGAKRVRTGHKIKIITHSIEDAIWQNPDIPIDYSELNHDGTKEQDDKVREEAKKDF
jgi:hypothetical protein